MRVRKKSKGLLSNRRKREKNKKPFSRRRHPVQRQQPDVFRLPRDLLERGSRAVDDPQEVGGGARRGGCRSGCSLPSGSNGGRLCG